MPRLKAGHFLFRKDLRAHRLQTILLRGDILVSLVCSFRTAVVLAFTVAVLCVGVQAQQNRRDPANTAGTYPLQLRDGTTGYGVAGKVGFARLDVSPANCHWTPQSPGPPHVPLEERKTDPYGKFELQSAEGCYWVDVEAPGYKAMNSYLFVSKGRNSGMTFVLDRLSQPQELQRATSTVPPGFTVYAGYVVDSPNFQPIEGAQVRDQVAGAKARTDASGFFVLHLPAKHAPNDTCSDIVDTFFVNAPGYKQEIRRNIVISDSGGGGNFELQRGSGTVDDSGQDTWDPPANEAAAAADTMSTWWEQSRWRNRCTPLLAEWRPLIPEIEKVLQQQKLGCSQPMSPSIVDAAKLADGPDVALVGYCAGGAYSDAIVAMQLENGKPVPAKFGDGPVEFLRSASVMHTVDVQLVPEANAIFNLGYGSDGCSHLLTCRANAYVWNAATKSFNFDAQLTRRARTDYCEHVQQQLELQAEKNAVNSTKEK